VYLDNSFFNIKSLARYPPTISAFKLVTWVVELTVKGAVPVATVEVNTPVKDNPPVIEISPVIDNGL
jgi:hypothetical protein